MHQAQGSIPNTQTTTKEQKEREKENKKERGKCNLSYETEGFAFLLSLLPSFFDFERFCEADSSLQM